MQFHIAFRSSIARRLTVSTFVCGLLAAAACERTPEWQGTPVTPPRKVVATAFADSLNNPVQLLPSAGEAALVFFGYTNCPDVCPTTLADWVRVKQAMGNDAKRVRFVFVTVDPERDTPAIAQRYAAKFDPTFLGLSASQQQVSALIETFGANAVRQPGEGDAGHVTAHSAQAFLLAPDGTILVSYRFGAGWDVMSADLKTLLDQ